MKVVPHQWHMKNPLASPPTDPPASRDPNVNIKRVPRDVVGRTVVRVPVPPKGTPNPFWRRWF